MVKWRVLKQKIIPTYKYSQKIGVGFLPYARKTTKLKESHTTNQPHSVIEIVYESWQEI